MGCDVSVDRGSPCGRLRSDSLQVTRRAELGVAHHDLGPREQPPPCTWLKPSLRSVTGLLVEAGPPAGCSPQRAQGWWSHS